MENATDVEGTSWESSIFPWLEAEEKNALAFPETVTNVLFAFVSVFSVLGTVGNLFILTALTRNPRLRRRATTSFVLNLALADCIFSCATGPFDAAVFYYRYWPYSDGLCTAVALIRHLSVGASLFSIQLITVNRFVSVVYPSWYCTLFGGSSCLLMVASSWIAPAAFLLPPTFRTWARFAYDSRDISCTITSGSVYKGFLYLGSACVPVVTFLRCYPPLFLALRRSQRRLTSHGVSSLRLQAIAGEDTSSSTTHTFLNVNRTASLVTLSTNGAKLSSARKPDRERQLLLVIVAIFGAFLVCYVPLLVIAGLDVAIDYPYLRSLTYVSFYASACANPLIYVVMSKEYRLAFMALFTIATQPRESDSETGTVNAL